MPSSAWKKKFLKLTPLISLHPSLLTRTPSPHLHPLSLHDALPISTWRGSTCRRTPCCPWRETSRTRKSCAPPSGCSATGSRRPLARGSRRRTARRRDRKSTRLNSSHTVMSYAVFCLEKKISEAHSSHFAPPLSLNSHAVPSPPPSFPTRRSSDLYMARQYVPANTVLSVAGNVTHQEVVRTAERLLGNWQPATFGAWFPAKNGQTTRSEEHTSELQSHSDVVCRLLLGKKNF